MKAYIFPGQGSQFEGMGKDLYNESSESKAYFDKANQILGFDITQTMIEGSAEDLLQTSVTQPAVFLHSVIRALITKDFAPDAVAGHSLGEFSALVAAKVLDFENALQLVSQRAGAMQRACNESDSTMAAILGLDNEVVEEVCESIDEIVVPANYNCPGQLVISGSIDGINRAVESLKEKGARRALVLPVNGAFHSPLMQSAKADLEKAIKETNFSNPICPIYQNVTGLPYTDPNEIQENLVNQLTSPVKWTQTMQNMIENGITEFIEVGGNGRTLSSFVKKVDRQFPTSSI